MPRRSLSMPPTYLAVELVAKELGMTMLAMELDFMLELKVVIYWLSIMLLLMRFTRKVLRSVWGIKLVWPARQFVFDAGSLFLWIYHAAPSPEDPNAGGEAGKIAVNWFLKGYLFGFRLFSCFYLNSKGNICHSSSLYGVMAVIVMPLCASIYRKC